MAFSDVLNTALQNASDIYRTRIGREYDQELMGLRQENNILQSYLAQDEINQAATPTETAGTANALNLPDSVKYGGLALAGVVGALLIVKAL